MDSANNTIWSDFIQTSEELYLSRSMRFSHDNREIWYNPLVIKDGINILEIGCAGGLLAHRIKELNPTCKVNGIDLDSGHIKYAKEKTAELNLGCHFMVGDATKLPFPDNSYDLTISHTVMEHIEPSKFLKEQYRVLTDGGSDVVLSVRSKSNITISPSNQFDATPEENFLFEKLYKNMSKLDEQLGVARHDLSEKEIILHFIKCGFKDIDVKFMMLNWYAPDNPHKLLSSSLNEIAVKKIHVIEAVHKAMRYKSSNLTNLEYQRLLELINTRFELRSQMVRDSQKIYDFESSCVMMVRGWK